MIQQYTVNILNGLRRSVRVHGNKPVILHDGGATSYVEFHDRVLRAGQALRGLGVERGDRVAVLMLNSPRYLELYFAAAAIGAVIVPVNIRWGADEIDFSLRDSGTKVLALDDRFASLQPDPLPMLLYTGGKECPAGMVSYEAVVAAARPAVEADPDEDDVLGLFYTSGTTGGPKGVMLTHRNIFQHAMLVGLELNITKREVYLNAAPMFHLANGSMTFLIPMMGAAHCFLPAFEPEGFLACVEKFGVTTALLVPTMFNLLINHPAIEKYDTSSLKSMIYGASPMPLELLRRLVAKFGPIFCQAYGMTEASPIMTLLRPEDHDFGARQITSAGRPMLGVELKVVDFMDREVKTGEAGEIVAQGPTVMKGYWNRPEANAEVLRGGWLHTGDIGAFDENGFVYILDRKKDMIKTGGENVYSPEVESALCAHPDILEATVFGVPDVKWGESIKAGVVVRVGKTLSEPDVIAWCRGRLTHFKCPSTVDFFDALPKGGTGKIQKNVLRAKYWEGKERGVN